jgi:hypothetical protein
LPKKDTINYLFQISSVSKQQCDSDISRACQQGAATSRGNIAEIQIVLQGGQLVPGTYRFGEGRLTSVEDVVIYSRQLYSEPSHGKLGCQMWGAGTFNVKKALYNADGKLEYLEASFSRICEQVTPFPPALPEENRSQIESKNIEKYTYHASWRSRLKISSR